MGGLLHLVQRGGVWAEECPPRCTKCNCAPINGQCTNFIVFDVALQWCRWRGTLAWSNGMASDYSDRAALLL